MSEASKSFSQKWKAAGLIWPSIMTALMLPVLIGLGTWQWHRKQWKEDLIAKISARVKAEPVSLKEALKQIRDTGEAEYMRVRATGVFDPDSERHVYAPTQQSQGWNIFTAFRSNDPEDPKIYVNRGWVPDNLKDPAKRPLSQSEAPVTITGLVRAPEKQGWFAPQSDPKQNRWYVRNPDDMQWNGMSPDQKQKVLQLAKFQSAANFYVDAEAEPANPGGWPKGGTTEFNIPNRHLEYVFTWYGFAVTLFVIFAVFARQRLAALDNNSKHPTNAS